MNDEATIKNLRKLIYAMDAFRMTESLSAALIDEKREISDVHYQALCTAVSVTYARPFLSADGVGPLASEYSKFPSDPDHAEIHKRLIEGRHTNFAHYSPDQAANLLGDETSTMEQGGVVVLIKNGRFGYRTPYIVWRRSEWGAVHQLSRFQLKRLAKAAEAAYAHLSKGKVFPDGEYILGKTFP